MLEATKAERLYEWLGFFVSVKRLAFLYFINAKMAIASAMRYQAKRARPCLLK